VEDEDREEDAGRDVVKVRVEVRVRGKVWVDRDRGQDPGASAFALSAGHAFLTSEESRASNTPVLNAGQR